jgi:hypothetical protein
MLVHLTQGGVFAPYECYVVDIELVEPENKFVRMV